MTGNCKNSYFFQAISLTLCCLVFSCAQKIDPKTADIEVRKLLQDAPGLNGHPPQHQNGLPERFRITPSSQRR